MALTRRQAVLAGLASPLGLGLGPARAEVWPRKPFKIICAFPAGGLTDVFARAYGAYIQQKTGHAVVVENKPGGGGAIGAQALKTAEPDGHTLMITVSTTLLGNRVLYKNLSYDVDRDFTFISLLSTGHLPLVAHKSTGASNIAEFVAFARVNKVSFGSYAAGSLAHIMCHELNKLYGLDMVVVNYRGEAPMWQDLLAGAIQVACGSFSAATAALDSGTARAIAVPTTRRMSKLPEVATFLEQGLTSKAFQLMSWVGLLGQAGMPEATVAAISELMVEAGRGAAIQKLLASVGVDDAAVDYKAFRQVYDSQGPVWLDLVRNLGLAAQ